MKWIALLLFVPSLSMAELQFPSDRLKVMDIETLQRIVAKKLIKAQRAVDDSMISSSDDGLPGGFSEDPVTRDEGEILITESLQLLFARPEQNTATSTVYNSIEGVALEYGGIFDFLTRLTDQALSTLDESGKSESLLRDQNTFIYILNNMIAEIQPLAKAPKGEKYRKLLERIRDEDIDFSDSLKSYRILHSMANIANPSKVAESIVGEKDCAWWEFLWC